MSVRFSEYLRSSNRPVSLFTAIVVGIPYGYLAHLVTDAPLSSMLLVGVVSFYVFLRGLNLLKTRLSRSIYVLIGFLKYGLVLLNATTKSVPFTGVDWGNYDRMARAAIESSTTLADLYVNSFDLFVFIITLVYKLFGHNIEQIFFFMIPLSIILFMYIHKTVLLITGSDRRASFAGLLVLAWPVNFVFSFSVLREAAIQTLIASSFYYFVLYIKGKASILRSLLPSAAAALMHSGLVVVPVVYVYFAMQRIKTRRVKLLRLGPVLACVFVVALMVVSPIGSVLGGQFSKIDSVDSLVLSLGAREDALSGATTAYTSSAPSSLGELIVSLPYRLVMFALSPFAWQIRGVDTLIAFIIDGVPQILLLLAIISIVRARKRHYGVIDGNIIMAGLVAIVMSYAIFAIGTNNYGTAMRHRAKVVPVAIAIVVSYYRTRRGRLNSRHTPIVGRTVEAKKAGEKNISVNSAAKEA